ncbi:protein PYRICULARIA ORYZAE RESISTANCE 21 [Vitis vinifera]|uniref:protein PYRICULARIA ORYZAE RESISTANCE 21 n=1 Tax=Vitis vinifera TaxID=29760 RepID=UPI00053F3069|nr:protein PYRICULARIA ORYZAE RESISTANCE 21 [Vitis vinifera]|eukprot:XP_010646271.1 PREDICTED: protein PYRICULARIA ORYZAE RESISTANCE 21 isoform X1 [Vitis vinifera]
MAEGTEMKLKVANPGCKCCNKKIKKLLCKFPEIRDQTFNEKDDTVIIKVVCCNPEKIRTKLMCKGCKIITCIEVIPPPPPPPPPPPTPTPPSPPPVHLVVIYPSGCRCDRRYGCRCEIVIEENPTCTIM